MLQWTQEDRGSLWGTSGMHPEVRLLDHKVVLFLVVWGTTILFSIMAEPIYVPTNNVCIQGFPFLCILANTFFSLIKAISDRYNRGLICISLMISNVEHVPDGHCMSSFKKCLFRSLAHFKNWVVCLPCHWIMWAPYVFWILTPYQVCDLQTFSPTQYVAFTFYWLFLCCAEAFYFDIAPLVNFFFCCLCFWYHIQKNHC